MISYSPLKNRFAKIKESEVPSEVKRKFRDLALSIQKAAILEALKMVEE